MWRPGEVVYKLYGHQPPGKGFSDGMKRQWSATIEEMQERRIHPRVTVEVLAENLERCSITQGHSVFGKRLQIKPKTS